MCCVPSRMWAKQLVGSCSRPRPRHPTMLYFYILCQSLDALGQPVVQLIYEARRSPHSSARVLFVACDEVASRSANLPAPARCISLVDGLVHPVPSPSSPLYDYRDFFIFFFFLFFLEPLVFFPGSVLAFRRSTGLLLTAFLYLPTTLPRWGC